MTSSRRRQTLGLATLLAAVVVVAPGVTRAQTVDAWWGPDKARHLGLAALFAPVGYAAVGLRTDDRLPRFLGGVGLSLSLGVAKEVYDLAGGGSPSWRDLTWSAVGALGGALVAFGIDRLLEALAPGR